jgi:hypothetical protein
MGALVLLKCSKNRCEAYTVTLTSRFILSSVVPLIKFNFIVSNFSYEYHFAISIFKSILSECPWLRL